MVVLFDGWPLHIHTFLRFAFVLSWVFFYLKSVYFIVQYRYIIKALISCGVTALKLICAFAFAYAKKQIIS